MKDDMLCTGAKECRKLGDDAVRLIHYGDKEVLQRPEYCSGRRPHKYNHEECSGMHCPFLNKWVECKRIWVKNPALNT